MPFQHDSSQQFIRIPLRRIEQRYGKDNHDNAGDDMVCCLRQVSKADAKYSFSFSTDHPNPWYHTLDFTFEGINETEYMKLIKLLSTHGLTED
ncbi:hypothetical protein DTL21_13950 [Bremerella cremea]|uniref:Uncharacterized protein n=1 Tax=Blastopirellula marina TaxID=124 RepID=A0A2S8FR02_9BACT|nr:MULTISPECIES: hypothetical protein [Pirellulaceae]PQO34609.1 hypothetical protein C5Y83_13945 [Blastopirellula marina]RCS47106.1 hypothetical protein DTL21_13950 [Bremerella cremea]